MNSRKTQLSLVMARPPVAFVLPKVISIVPDDVPVLTGHYISVYSVRALDDSDTLLSSPGSDY